MKTKVKLTCPYCQNEFWQSLDLTDRFISRHVILCDVDETPGCDKYFLIAIYLDPVVTTYKLVEE